MTLIERNGGEESTPKLERTFEKVHDPHLKGYLEELNTRIPDYKYLTNLEVSSIIFTSSKNRPLPQRIKTFMDNLRQNGVIPYRLDKIQRNRYLQTREEVLAIGALLWETRYKHFQLKRGDDTKILELREKLGDDDLKVLIRPNQLDPWKQEPNSVGRPAKSGFHQNIPFKTDPNWDTNPNLIDEEEEEESYSPSYVYHHTESEVKVDDNTYFRRITNDSLVESSKWNLEKFGEVKKLLETKDKWEEVSTTEIPFSVLINLVMIDEAKTQKYTPPETVLEDLTYGQLKELLVEPETYLKQFPQIKSLRNIMLVLRRKFTK